MATITITINPDPTKPVRVAVSGVTGQGCTQLTDSIQAALGHTTDTQHTDEYDMAPTRTQQQMRAEL